MLNRTIYARLLRFRRFELIPFVASALLLGCADKDAGPRFASGSVSVGFKKEVTLRQAIEFAALNADSIGIASGFYYYSNLPNDSLDFINEMFMSEGVEPASAFVSATENRIVVIKNYYHLADNSSITEWLSVTEDPILQFEDKQNDKGMLLFIQSGAELQWIARFRSHPYVRYANPDYYGYITPSMQD